MVELSPDESERKLLIFPLCNPSPPSQHFNLIYIPKVKPPSDTSTEAFLLIILLLKVPAHTKYPTWNAEKKPKPFFHIFRESRGFRADFKVAPAASSFLSRYETILKEKVCCYNVNICCIHKTRVFTLISKFTAHRLCA